MLLFQISGQENPSPNPLTLPFLTFILVPTSNFTSIIRAICQQWPCLLGCQGKLENVIVEKQNSCFGSKHSVFSFGPFSEFPGDSVVMFASVEVGVSCMGRMHRPPPLSNSSGPQAVTTPGGGGGGTEQQNLDALERRRWEAADVNLLVEHRLTHGGGTQSPVFTAPALSPPPHPPYPPSLLTHSLAR